DVAAVERLAAMDGAAFRTGLAERRLHGVDRLAVDQRPDQDAALQRIADRGARPDMLQAGYQAGIDAVVDEQPPQRRAALAGRAHGGEGDRPRREIEVRRRRD